PRTRIRRLFEAQDGDLLVAAASGLYRLTGDGWRSWACTEDTSCNSVFAVLEQADGSLLIGTSAGLHQTSGGSVIRPATPELQISRPVYFLVRDSLERLWFGTDDGVLRWDGRELDHFSVADGLAGRETHRAAGAVDSHGKVWIGTERGVTVYDESRAEAKRAAPLVSLTGVDASGRFLPLDMAQRLAHDEDDLIFHYRAISLLDEDRVLQSSWLEGFDDEWSPPAIAPKRELRFTNLEPGTYVLHLKAANAEGTWSAVTSSAPLTIARPFWRQTWFFATLAGLLIAALYAMASNYQQRKYSRRLEAQVAERLAQLMTEKERLSQTLRNIGDAVITTASDGQITMLNPTAEEITGWKNADAVGRSLDQILRLFEVEPTGEAGDKLPLPGADNPEIFEEPQSVLLRTQTGTDRLIEISGSPILSSIGGYTGLVLGFRDITQKQELEAEIAKSQKLEALGLLAGGIAHDFNNLLTVLLGNLSLLGTSSTPESQRARHLEDAETAVLRARDLTQQLLTFSRGGAPVRKAASIVEVIHDSASFVMSGSKVRCDIDLVPDLWVVEIDAGQVSQVVNNLLINAIQAMPDGGTVRIAGRNTTTPPLSLDSGKYVVIDVIDTGVGIPQRHQARVFDPYFSTKQQGRGLGLASAYSIAKQHDGLLTVQSQPGEGTVFSLYLPASTTQTLKRPAAHAKPGSGGGRVLIMDDEAGVRHVTGSIVAQLGYRAELVADGREAIDRYREARGHERPYDVVIMDLTIPGGMGGQEAIVRLLELDPEVRAIVMSGYSNDPVLANFRDYGFLGVITKPFKSDDLARVLSEVLTEEGTLESSGSVSAPPPSS
ncbi:MAG: ATP-binding protein, partial [Acidobacteriota bacterium]